MKNYFLIIIFLITLNSCTGDKGIFTSFNKEYNYFPLNVGNTWFYDLMGIFDSPWIKRIVQEKLEINDSIYYAVTDIYGYNGASPHSYTDTLRLDYQGRIWHYKNKKDHLLFDFSLENEGTYQYEDFIVTVKKVGLIETKAGKFNNFNFTLINIIVLR